MDAAEDDDVRAGFLRLERKPQGIAHEVGRLLNFRQLVVVRQQNGIPGRRQSPDLSDSTGRLPRVGHPPELRDRFRRALPGSGFTIHCNRAR